MPSTPEAIKKIVNFVPENPRREVEINLGRVDGGIELVYGVHSYQQRLMGIPEEPLTGRRTGQPVLALKSTDRNGRVIRYTLAYATDVRALGDGLATAILNRLAATPERRQIL